MFFRDGEENTHSLLAGSNANEGTTLIPTPVTRSEWKSQIETRYGSRAEEYFKIYPVQLRPGGMGSDHRCCTRLDGRNRV